MKRILKSSFLFLAVVLSSSSHTCALPSLKGGICGDYPVGGLLEMKFGYDIREYTSEAFASSKRDEILSYTCNDNSSTVKFLVTGKKITWPDQIQAPFPETKKSYDEHATFLDHFEAFDKAEGSGLKTGEKTETFSKLGESVSSLGNMIPGVGSVIGGVIGTIFGAAGAIMEELAPPQPKTISQFSKFLNSSEYRASVNYNVEVYTLAFKDSKELKVEDTFVKAYRRLPASFENNTQAFIDFFNRFGTHYIYKAKFGARIIHSTTHKKTSQGSSERNEIEKEYKVWMQKFLEVANQSKTFEDKIQGLDVHSEVIGGDTSKLNLNGQFKPTEIKEWEESVYDNPRPIETSLVPIIDLVHNTSIQIQLSLALVYVVKLESIKRYKELMKVIKKNSFSEKIFSQKIFKLNNSYSGTFEDMMNSLNVSESAEDILMKETKSLRGKAYELTALYQNIFAITQLYEQMSMNDDIRDAAKTISKTYACDTQKKFHKTDTGFGDTDFNWKDYKATQTLVEGLGSRLKEASALSELNDKLNVLRSGNNKILSLRTMDCEDLEPARARNECYGFFLCGVHKFMKGWNPKENLNENFEKRTPAMTYLKTMLMPMQHSVRWEYFRALYDHMGWREWCATVMTAC